MKLTPASAPEAGADDHAVFRASSGLEAYDRARFHGAAPAHGQAIKSSFGYASLLQQRLRRVPEVVVDASADLVIFMVVSNKHAMEVWMDGRHRKLELRRNDLIVIPPGVETRWCASEGQACVLHLHVSAARLADAAAEDAGFVRIPPRLAFRDAGLQRIMQAVGRVDNIDQMASTKVAALGSAALLHLLK